MDKCARIQNTEDNKCIRSIPRIPPKLISWRFDLRFNWRLVISGLLGWKRSPGSWMQGCRLHAVIDGYWGHTSSWAATCEGVQVPWCKAMESIVIGDRFPWVDNSTKIITERPNTAFQERSGRRSGGGGRSRHTEEGSRSGHLGTRFLQRQSHGHRGSIDRTAALQNNPIPTDERRWFWTKQFVRFLRKKSLCRALVTGVYKTRRETESGGVT